MEKEMKKLLLVAVSVGVFLMITIIVALTIIPKGQTQESAYYTSIPLSQGRVQPAAEIAAIIPAEAANNEIAVIADRTNGASLTIQIPVPSSAAVPDTAAAAPRPAAAAPARQPAAAQPQAARQPSAAAARAAPAASRTSNDYWIQIGAYSAIIRAEDVKELLADKGLISIIENRNINGQNLYRVRLGPYTSEREANHWLAIVRDIDGFQESQVRQTIRHQ